MSVALSLTFLLTSLECFQPFSQVFYCVLVSCANMHFPLKGASQNWGQSRSWFWKWSCVMFKKYAKTFSLYSIVFFLYTCMTVSLLDCYDRIQKFTAFKLLRRHVVVFDKQSGIFLGAEGVFGFLRWLVCFSVLVQNTICTSQKIFKLWLHLANSRHIL